MTTPTTKTASRRKAKWTRPVSRKFYQSICRQVHDVSLLSEDITESNVMQCIDDYIDTGNAHVKFTDAETVVFTLLQPLIDKAMTRSMRARAAAARRRQAKACSDTPETPTPTVPDQPQTTEAKTSADTAKTAATTVETTATQSTANATREEKRAKHRETALIRRQEKRRKRLARRHNPHPLKLSSNVASAK